MLISRCAWHPRNHGHAKLLGVVSWKGWRVEYTDGICQACAVRMHGARRVGVPASAPRTRPGHTSEVVVVALAVMTGLVLIARPTNDTPPPIEVNALPRAAAVPVRTVAAEPGAAPDRLLVRSARPRPVRWTVPATRGPAARGGTQSP